MKSKRIGMLGAGNMAAALMRGLIASGTVVASQIRASDQRPERLAELQDEFGISSCANNVDLVEWADIVVLAVKPQVVDRVLDEIAPRFSSNTLLVSVAAGVPAKAIEGRLGGAVRVVRAMPNTAAIVRAGATGVAPGRQATSQDIELARQLFDAVGCTVVLDESLLDAVTGLSGSGPAYVMLMIEALADGGVKVGLRRDTSLLLAAQTVFGSAKLLLDTNEHPGRLKDMVTSPGGTAIAGLHTLESGALRRTLIDAVESASARAAELGQSFSEQLEKKGV